EKYFQYFARSSGGAVIRHGIVREFAARIIRPTCPNEKQPLNTRKIMNNSKTETARFVPRCTRRVLLALLLGIAFVSMAWWAGRAGENHHATRVRWDIIHISAFSPLTVNAGGQASAKANNGAWITLT